MSDSAPPGWYPDPRDPRVEFWWDGSAYGPSRPAPVAPYAVVPSAPVTYAPAPVMVVRPTHDAYGRPISPKSRTIAVILGFFLGGLGIDRFYLGNVGMGVAKLLVGWLTAGIWPLIDWIIILAGAAHDGDGLPVINWN